MSKVSSILFLMRQKVTFICKNISLDEKPVQKGIFIKKYDDQFSLNFKLFSAFKHSKKCLWKAI